MAAATSALAVAPMMPTNNNNPNTLPVSASQYIPGEYPGSLSALDSVDATNLSLTQAVHARRAEYTTPQSIRIKVGTWNVAAFKDTDKDIGAWFVGKEAGSGSIPSSIKSSMHKSMPLSPHNTQETLSDQPSSVKDDKQDIGLYVLGLQEVVDINSAVEAFRPYSASSTSTKFKTALQESMPRGYRFIAEHQLTGLLLLIFAAPDIAPHIHSVSTTSVGTGLMGYMGNKGAVAARIVLGETTRLIFINSHLSSGLGKAELERRNWDTAQIGTRIRFDPIADTFGVTENTGEKIGEEDFAFWFGDLNYRLEGVPGEDIRRILTLHTTNRYQNMQNPQDKIQDGLKYIESKLAGSDIKTRSSSEQNASYYSVSGKHDEPYEDEDASADDPTSLQAIVNSLLPHDELHQQQKAGRAFHNGWKEGDINFLPTYKYDVGSVSTFDSGEKKRGPSWCDRILFRTKTDRLRYEERVLLEQQAKKRDDQMTSQGIASAAEDENTMFEYDPDNDDDDYDDRSEQSDLDTSMTLHEDKEDAITLEHYTSHQDIVTSDHKPLDCVFTLAYDAVNFELKSKVQSEIARDLDRAENEGRPVVTVIVEGGSQENDADFDGANFGDVRYDDPKTCFITIANTGSVSAQFGFLDHPAQDADLNHLPAWLSINFHNAPDKLESTSSDGSSKPKAGSDLWSAGISKIFELDPGETTAVDLVCHVKEKSLVKRLNDGDALDEILVLRIKSGRDHFLPVKGSWRSSVQGRTIERLVRIPEGGVRALQEPPVRQPQAEDSSSQAVMWSAPREIFRLTESIESLTERITAEWSMLGTSAELGARPPLVAVAGWPFVEESWTLDRGTRQRLRVDVNEALDTDRSFDSILSSRLPPLHRLEVFADTLLDFLSNLQDGVIPATLWERLEAEFFSKEKMKTKMSVEDKRGAILEILSSSQSHSISFVLLTSMLARISQDVVGAVQGVQPGTSTEIPDSPRVKIKRKSLDPDPTNATKMLIQMNYSAVFADILIQHPDSGGKGKNAGAGLNHKRELIEIFLQSTA